MPFPTVPINPDSDPGGEQSGSGTSSQSGTPESINRGYQSGVKGFTQREMRNIIRRMLPTLTQQYGGQDIPTLSIVGSGLFDLDGSEGYIHWPDTDAHISSEAPSSLTLFQHITIPGNLTLSGLTSGSVLFAGASGIVSEDNTNLFWDDANNRLGIGTAVPTETLHVSGDARITTDLTLSALSSGSVLFAGVGGVVSEDNSDFFWDNVNKRLGLGTTTPDVDLHLKGTGDINVRIEADSDNSGEGDQPTLELWQDGGLVRTAIGLYNSLNDVTIGNFYSAGGIRFAAGGPTRMYLSLAGDLGIGDLTPNAKLHVAGDVLFEGSVTLAVLETSSNTVFDDDMYHVSIDATAGVRSGTLPALGSTVLGTIYILSKSDGGGNAVNLTPNGTDTINGVNAAVGITIQYEALKVQALASDWRII